MQSPQVYIEGGAEGQNNLWVDRIFVGSRTRKVYDTSHERVKAFSTPGRLFHYDVFE